MSAVLSVHPLNPFGFVKWLAAAIIIVFAVSQHALEKHGEVAAVIHDCNNRGETLMTWQSPNTGRFLLCVKLTRGWGVEVRDQSGQNITAFRDRRDSLDSIVRYLLNKGAFPANAATIKYVLEHVKDPALLQTVVETAYRNLNDQEMRIWLSMVWQSLR